MSMSIHAPEPDVCIKNLSNTSPSGAGQCDINISPLTPTTDKTNDGGDGLQSGNRSPPEETPAPSYLYTRRRSRSCLELGHDVGLLYEQNCSWGAARLGKDDLTLSTKSLSRSKSSRNPVACTWRSKAPSFRHLLFGNYSHHDPDGMSNIPTSHSPFFPPDRSTSSTSLALKSMSSSVPRPTGKPSTALVNDGRAFQPSSSSSSCSSSSPLPSKCLLSSPPSSSTPPRSSSRRWETWLLLLWCHLSQILAGGLLKSLAVFLDDILQEFDSSVAFMGWMFSLEAFFFGVTCPFASYATKRLGPRVVMMTGGLVNGAGILLASLATNIFMVGIGISVIAGVGSSMIYVAALVTVRRNFQTFYAVANGLTLAGVSVAVFMFPPIIRTLINHYGWRGALTILSALSLNTMVTGAQMRCSRVGRKKQDVLRDEGESKPFVEHNVVSVDGKSGAVCSMCQCALRQDAEDMDVAFHAVEDLCFNCCSDKFGKDYALKKSGLALQSVYPDDGVVRSERRVAVGRRRPSVMERTVSFVTENLTHGLLVIVVVMWSMANTATMKYLVAAGKQRGLTSIQAAMLLSTTGVTQCLSLVINGVIISRGWLTPLQLYQVVFVLMAGAEFGLAVFRHYILGILASALFGLGTGTIISLNLVVQRTLDSRAGVQAAGWIIFFEGIAGCIGGLSVGAVRDVTGSYALSFVTAGVLTLGGATLVLLIILIRRVKRSRLAPRPSAAQL